MNLRYFLYMYLLAFDAHLWQRLIIHALLRTSLAIGLIAVQSSS